MIIDTNNKKEIIDFLIDRWEKIIQFAAIEKVSIAMHKFLIDNNLPIEAKQIISVPLACLQISIIKQKITDIIPEVDFINYDYESPAPLNINDFVEVFSEDHLQCIDKLKEAICKMQIK